MFQMSGVFLVGIIPICISVLMHAKDIKIENERLAKFLKAISIIIILASVFILAIGPLVLSEILISIK